MNKFNIDLMRKDAKKLSSMEFKKKYNVDKDSALTLSDAELEKIAGGMGKVQHPTFGLKSGI